MKTLLPFLSLYLLTLGFSEHVNAGGLDGLPTCQHRDLSLLADVPKHEHSGRVFCYSFDLAKPSQETPSVGRYYLKADWQIEREVAAKKRREEIAVRLPSRRVLAKDFADSFRQP